MLKKPAILVEIMPELIDEMQNVHSSFLKCVKIIFQALEALGVDGVLLPDVHISECFTGIKLDSFSRLSPIVIASFIASRSGHLCVIPEILTSTSEPYITALQIASLSHFTNARVGVCLSTANQLQLETYMSPYPDNVNLIGEHMEYIEVLKKLWNGWKIGAVIQDKESGRYIDANKIETTHHKGSYFQVRGPLTVPRTVEQPVIFIRSDDCINQTQKINSGEIIIWTKQQPPKVNYKNNDLPTPVLLSVPLTESSSADFFTDTLVNAQNINAIGIHVKLMSHLMLSNFREFMLQNIFFNSVADQFPRVTIRQRFGLSFLPGGSVDVF